MDIQTATVANSITANPEIKLTLVVGNADVSNIFLKGYAGNIASQSLPAGIELSSSLGNAANTLDYLRNVSMSVAAIRMQTDNVSNFQETLVIGQLLPPALQPSIKNIDLTKYRISNGNGYSDVITIDNEPFVTFSAFYMKLSKLKAGSTLNIWLSVPAVGATVTVTPVSSLN